MQISVHSTNTSFSYDLCQANQQEHANFRCLSRKLKLETNRTASSDIDKNIKRSVRIFAM